MFSEARGPGVILQYVSYVSVLSLSWSQTCNNTQTLVIRVGKWKPFREVRSVPFHGCMQTIFGKWLLLFPVCSCSFVILNEPIHQLEWQLSNLKKEKYHLFQLHLVLKSIQTVYILSNPATQHNGKKILAVTCNSMFPTDVCAWWASDKRF